MLVLLRPRLRAARRSPARRPVRQDHPGQDQRRAGAPLRAGEEVLEEGDSRHRRGHRSIPAGGRPLQAHAQVPRGAARFQQPDGSHHARSDDRPRHRRADRAREAGRPRRDLQHPDDRHGRLAQDRARHGATAAATASDREARRRRHQGERRHGADPAWAIRQARADRGGGQSRARCGGDRRVGRHAAPASRHARALHDGARAPLARARAEVRAHVPRPPVPAGGGHASRRCERWLGCASCTRCATGAVSGCSPRHHRNSFRC